MGLMAYLVVAVLLSLAVVAVTARTRLQSTGARAAAVGYARAAFHEPVFQSFYYNSLGDKLIETTSTGQCSIKSVHNSDSIGKKLIRQVEASVIPILDKEPDREGLLHVFSTNICDLAETKTYLRRRQANSCTRAGRDTSKPGLIRAGHLHPDHPRCKPGNADILKKYCAAGVHLRNDTDLSTIKLKTHQAALRTSPPFLITAQNVLLSKSGMVWHQCGLISLLGSCGALRYSVKEAMRLEPFRKECTRRSSTCPLPRVESPVFTIAQLDDTQIGQFMLESLPRLLANYDMLMKNPKIKIHFGFSSKHTNSSQYIEDIRKLTAFRVLKWLNLGERVITGALAAGVVYLPREGACQDPLYNTYELLAMKKILVNQAWNRCEECDEMFKRRGISTDRESRVAIIVQRDKSALYSQNRFDKSRRWGEEEVNTITRAASRAWCQVQGESSPHCDLNIIVFSDSDVALMECIPCQIRLFSLAHMVIGMHGAGLANTLFMPAGGDVLEVVSESHLDVRHFPYVGIFPRLSAAVALNHYTLMCPVVEKSSNLLIDEKYFTEYLKRYFEIRKIGIRNDI